MSMPGRRPPGELLAAAVDRLERVEVLDAIADPIRHQAQRLFRIGACPKPGERYGSWPPGPSGPR